MHSKQDNPHKAEKLHFYMDLVGHDVLNNNQAVLSYLELILASPAADKSIRRYAEKAAAHARSSTLLVEDIKRILAARSVVASELKTVDLVSAATNMEREAAQLLPSKKVTFNNQFSVKSAQAMGGNLVPSILLNVLIDAIRIDQNEDVALGVVISEDESKEFWSARVENKNVRISAIAGGKGLESVYSLDSSRVVKITGMVFAKMASGIIGGDFDAVELDGKKGAAFVIKLRKAGGRL